MHRDIRVFPEDSVLSRMEIWVEHPKIGLVM
jgi:hypothetical protein